MHAGSTCGIHWSPYEAPASSRESAIGASPWNASMQPGSTSVIPTSRMNGEGTPSPSSVYASSRKKRRSSMERNRPVLVNTWTIADADSVGVGAEGYGSETPPAAAARRIDQPSPTMRLIVAGSRTVRDAAVVAEAIAASAWAPTAVLHGASPGVDRLADAWARARGVPVEAFPPADDTDAAKHARNAQMAASGEALVAVWDPASADTTPDMIARARAAGLPVFVRTVELACQRTTATGLVSASPPAWSRTMYVPGTSPDGSNCAS